MCYDNYNHLLKYRFGICLCSMLISLSNISNVLQNGQFPILEAIFVTIASLKVKIIQELYTLTFLLINLREEYFSLIGGPKMPLNACSSLKFLT